MKKHLTLLTIALALTGCATTRNTCPPGDTACVVAEHEKQLKLWAADLRDIAHLGTLAALGEDPGLRPVFSGLVAGLTILQSGEAPTVAELVTLLQASGVKNIQSPKGQLYVTGGTIIVRRLVGSTEVVNSDEVKLFAGALADGFAEALTKGR